jgi:hypothetical protein
LSIAPGAAEAGWPFAKHRTRTQAQRVVVPTSRTIADPNLPPGMLGSFYPTPYMVVRGNAPAGGGYSPLGMYTDAPLDVTGPLSSLRPASAPVAVYQRGYDGRLLQTEGTSTSYPNLPAASPVIYPTQATYYYGFRESRTPPWWKSGINWIDQD